MGPEITVCDIIAKLRFFEVHLALSTLCFISEQWLGCYVVEQSHPSLGSNPGAVPDIRCAVFLSSQS